MKNAVLILLLLSISLLGSGQNGPSTESINRFYAAVVNEGLVHYDLARENGDLLNEIVTEIGQAELVGMAANERKAFYLNTYNVLVILGVLNHYPIASPLEVPGFFKRIPYGIAGESWTLDHLENEVIRKEHSDARIHFALVCGATGCPRIRSTAYTANNLDAELDEQSREALNSSWFVYEKAEEKAVYVSQIFEWFSDDFGGKSQVLAYINPFRKVAFDEEWKVKFYPYDWSLNAAGADNATLSEALETIGQPADDFNLQTFTGGSLLGYKQLDLTLFNTIYTQTMSNWKGERFNSSRETFATHLLQATYGVSKSGRFNIGLEASLRASAQRSDLGSGSVADVYTFANNDSTRVGISNVGLRLKVQPFRAVSNFSIQSTISIPTIDDPEGTGPDRYFVDWDRLVWWNQFFYDKTFGDFQLFTSLETVFRFGIYEGQTSAVDLPVKAFLSYFPSDQVTFYVMSEHVPRLRYDTELSEQSLQDNITTSGNYTASGAGFKYQFGDRLNMELLYTNFWRSRNAGLGNTFNVGLKYIVG